MTGLATAIAVLHVDWRVSVWSMSIRMPGGTACEGVCIAAGVTVVAGACERRRENRVHGGVKCVLAKVQSEWADVWKPDRRPHLQGS
jgi:hypothetical protein